MADQMAEKKVANLVESSADDWVVPRVVARVVDLAESLVALMVVRSAERWVGCWAGGSAVWKVESLVLQLADCLVGDLVERTVGSLVIL